MDEEELIQKLVFDSRGRSVAYGQPRDEKLRRVGKLPDVTTTPMAYRFTKPKPGQLMDTRAQAPASGCTGVRLTKVEGLGGRKQSDVEGIELDSWVFSLEPSAYATWRWYMLVPGVLEYGVYPWARRDLLQIKLVEWNETIEPSLRQKVSTEFILHGHAHNQLQRIVLAHDRNAIVWGLRALPERLSGSAPFFGCCVMKQGECR